MSPPLQDLPVWNLSEPSESSSWELVLTLTGDSQIALWESLVKLWLWGYEIGAVSHLYLHNCIDCMTEHSPILVFFGIDEEIIGTVFELPFFDGEPPFLLNLLRRGVPIFGI